MSYHHRLHTDFLRAFALGPGEKVETPAFTQRSDATIEEVVAEMLDAQELGEDLAEMLNIVEMCARGQVLACQEVAIALRKKFADEHADTHADAAYVEAREMGAMA